MISLFDSHSHIFLSKGDIREIVWRCKTKGIRYFIENGLDYKSNLTVLEESEKFDIVLPAIGIHPTGVEKMSEDEINIIFQQIEEYSNKIVAIGEVGLDYYWNHSEEIIKKQKRVFENIIEIAEKLKKPIIVHSRSAEREVIEYAYSTKIPFILHSYGGKLEYIKNVGENVYFSIPAIVYKLKHFQNLVKVIDMDKLLTETDSPFLDPIEYRNNEPWKVLYGLKTISKILNMDLEDVGRIIEKNFNVLFLKSNF